MRNASDDDDDAANGGTGNGSRNGNNNSSSVKKKTAQSFSSSSSSFVARFLDPTRVFSLLVIAIMVYRYLEEEQWRFERALWGFFWNPFVVLAFAVSSAVPYFAVTKRNDSNNNKQKPLPLSASDKMAAEWYWWNAWLYHLVMDGFSGSFQLVPVVVQQYNTLDDRFRTHHVVPWTIGVIEIACMAPFCLLTIWAILARHPLRYPLELVTSTFQFTGMVVFVAAEVYEGQLNVPALDPVGVPGDRWANLKVWDCDLYHFTYYWFGFWFCNLVWGFVPAYRIARSLYECQTRMMTMRDDDTVAAAATSTKKRV